MTVRSVSRAISILDLVSQRQGIGVTDIARHLDLHKSTVSRLLLTLEELGVVELYTDERGFRVREKLLKIAGIPHTPADLVSQAKPFMDELCQAIGEDVGLAGIANR